MTTNPTTSPDLSPAVAIGGNAIEDTAALYDGGDGPTNEQILALRATNSTDGWSVVDHNGGRWWPDEGAWAEIEAVDDPAAVAVRICQEQPMRGEWCS